jgi:hypothetical protein
VLEADCQCVCHTGGAFPPACSVAGGCGPHEDRPRCTGNRCAVADENGTCRPCHNTTLRALTGGGDGVTGEDEWPSYTGLYVMLWTRLTPGQGGSGTRVRVSASKTAPLPISVDVHDHLDQMASVVTGWAQEVADWRTLAGYRVEPLRRPRRFIAGQGVVRLEQRADRDLRAARVHAAVTWLLPHLDWATQQEWGVDLSEEIRDAASSGRSLAQLNPAPTDLRGEVICPSCKLLMLVREPASDYYRCLNCKIYLTRRQYQQWALEFAANPRRAVREWEAALRDSASALGKVKGGGRHAAHMHGLADRIDAERAEQSATASRPA